MVGHVLGAQIAGALVALDLGDDGPDMERRFDFVITAPVRRCLDRTGWTVSMPAGNHRHDHSSADVQASDRARTTKRRPGIVNGTILSVGGSYVGMDIDVVSVTERAAEATPGVSETGFTALVAEHHGDLVRLAYAIVGDPDIANDVAQSAWAAAWRSRHRLRDPEKVRGWLLTITANEARRSLRRRRLRQFIPLADERTPMTPARQPEDQIDLIQAMQRLRPRDREILARRYALGQTSQKIAEEVGMSDSGVRVRIGRLLQMLREELAT